MHSQRTPPTEGSRLKVMRKRRGRSLHRKILEYGELFNLDVVLIAQDRASGEYEVFEPNENWPVIKDISPTIVHVSRKAGDVGGGGNLQSKLQRMEKLVKQSRVPKPPRPRVLCTSILQF
ncbi:hypothetical protein F5X96DRAFT_670701 [Biscogniauxia mediterranea]|nr:hypothetical protein F5X96DRAFT_670701 [Biscogniauxia mediterranea]